MMPCIKMFGKIIRKIFLSWMPRDVKILYFDLVGDPKEVLFHGSWKKLHAAHQLLCHLLCVLRW
jgi:hypothetical protein